MRGRALTGALGRGSGGPGDHARCLDGFPVPSNLHDLPRPSQDLNDRNSHLEEIFNWEIHGGVTGRGIINASQKRVRGAGCHLKGGLIYPRTSCPSSA